MDLELLKVHTKFPPGDTLKAEGIRGAWLAQSVDHVVLDLEFVSSSPTLGEEIT